MMPTACLALKIAAIALLIAFAMRLCRESLVFRSVVLCAAPLALLVAYAVPSNPLNLPIAGTMTAFAIALSTNKGG